MEWYRVVQMGSSGSSSRVGSELVLRIEPEFGVRSCVTRSCNNHLTFICSDPSNPYILFLEPHFCFISYVWPLCFLAVHLLCTIFNFCFLFQVMHSNHSSISKHVIFLLVLQYGNQLGQASTSILTSVWPSNLTLTLWNRGTILV